MPIPSGAIPAARSRGRAPARACASFRLLNSPSWERSSTNHRACRSLLATTHGLTGPISGVILHEETLFQDSVTATGDPGPTIAERFAEQGIVPGIKVDQGVEPLARGLAGETWCTGLKGLAERENAWGLARYARTVQDAGLVPIVELEILMDGDPDIATRASVQEWVLRTVYEALAMNGVFLEGSLPKPSLFAKLAADAEGA
jgi:fructose-bisphosphate aldolase class I